tara:strand:- start:2061 stop:2591 length:531 start_codon:yes stop_codon:yes gene_type:complete
MFTSSDFWEDSFTSQHNQYIDQSNINYHLTEDISGKKIEEVMSTLHHGLISSAPWETIAEYLRDRSLENALNVFKTINKVNLVAYCSELGDGESFFTASGDITDDDIELLRSCGIKYLNDSSITIDGIKFWGSPIQPWFHDWAFNRKRGNEIRKHWELIPTNTDVLLTHGPPFWKY